MLTRLQRRAACHRPNCRRKLAIHQSLVRSEIISVSGLQVLHGAGQEVRVEGGAAVAGLRENQDSAARQ